MNNFSKFKNQQIQNRENIKGGVTFTTTTQNIVSQDLQDWWKCRDGQYDLTRDISRISNDNAGNEIILGG